MLKTKCSISLIFIFFIIFAFLSNGQMLQKTFKEMNPLKKSGTFFYVFTRNLISVARSPLRERNMSDSKSRTVGAWKWTSGSLSQVFEAVMCHTDFISGCVVLCNWVLAQTALLKMNGIIACWVFAVCLLAAAGKKLLPLSSLFLIRPASISLLYHMWYWFPLTHSSRWDAEYTRRKDVDGNQSSWRERRRIPHQGSHSGTF